MIPLLAYNVNMSKGHNSRTEELTRPKFVLNVEFCGTCNMHCVQVLRFGIGKLKVRDLKQNSAFFFIRKGHNSRMVKVARTPSKLRHDLCFVVISIVCKIHNILLRQTVQ